MGRSHFEGGLFRRFVNPRIPFATLPDELAAIEAQIDRWTRQMNREPEPRRALRLAVLIAEARAVAGTARATADAKAQH